MRRMILALGILGGVLWAASPASAQYYYDPGYGRHPAPYYQGRNPYYAPRHYNRRAYRGRAYQRQPRCPHNWTVQDGVCKPYRGY